MWQTSARLRIGDEAAWPLIRVQIASVTRYIGTRERGGSLAAMKRGHVSSEGSSSDAVAIFRSPSASIFFQLYARVQA